MALKNWEGVWREEHPHPLTFFLLRQIESNKEKGDFFPKAPPEKKSSALLSQSIYHHHGAEILPILAAIELFNRISILLLIHYRIRIYDSLKAPS